MKKKIIWCSIIIIGALIVCSVIGSFLPQPTQQSVAAAPTPVTPTATPTPTGQAGYPVCNARATNTPCVMFASIQDAASGEASSGADVTTSMSGGIVKVKDDLTYAGSSERALDVVQFQCFNIQQALWYINSTINAGRGQTFRKSAFTEVDITFVNQNIVFASCHLTSAIVDKIDKAGMWDNGDYVGAWAAYDSASFA